MAPRLPIPRPSRKRVKLKSQVMKVKKKMMLSIESPGVIRLAPGYH
jgi:hypothetical protein